MESKDAIIRLQYRCPDLYPTDINIVEHLEELNGISRNKNIEFTDKMERSNNEKISSLENKIATEKKWINFMEALVPELAAIHEEAILDFEKEYLITVSEMSKMAQYKGINLTPAIIVCIELINQMGTNALYDMLKYALLSVTDTMHKYKYEYKHDYEVKVTVVTVENKEERFQISINENLTDGQKDKLIDAAIKKFLDL